MSATGRAAAARAASIGYQAGTGGTSGGPDTTAPVISNLSAAAITTTTATITFATDELATSNVQYDTNSGFSGPTTVAASSSLALSHSKQITSLTANTTYYYRANATDASSNASAYTSTGSFVTTGGGAAWVDSGTITNVTIGSMSLDATFNSITIEVPITETSPGDVTSATVEFRESTGPGTTRAGLPLWIIRPTGAQAACYGKVLLLTHNTAYDVRVTLSSATETALKSASATTRNDALTAAASLVTTHYVATTGTDSGLGTSSGSPWRTLEYARAHAPSGAVVQVAAGWYRKTTNPSTQSIIWKAETPAVNDSRAVINSGSHSVVFDFQTGPTGAVDAHLTAVAPWTLNDAPNNIYKWAAGATAAGIRQVSVCATLNGTPLRIANWKKSGDCATYAQWVTTMTTNLNYNYGSWTDTTGDVYIRLPAVAASQNPNDLYVTMGGNATATNGYGFYFNGANCRATGFEFRALQSGVQVGPSATFAHVDHCLSYQIIALGRVFGTKIVNGVSSTYGSDHVFEYNRIVDSGMWTTSSPTALNTIPWTFIKGQVVKADGVTLHSPNRLGEAVEGHAIDFPGGGRRCIVRYCSAYGTFNGFGGNSTDFNRYANYGLDLHDCYVTETADEALEFETSQICGAFWNIRAEHCKEFCSTSPLNYGPQYYFRSSGWQLGAHGLGAWPNNSQNVPGSGGVHKYSPPTTATRARLYFLHLTFWCNTTTPMGLFSQGIHSGGGSSPMPDVYMRNCIWRTPGRIVDWDADVSRIDCDYNIFITGHATEGFKYSGTTYDTLAEVPAWRSVLLTNTTHAVTHAQILNSVDIAFSDDTTVDALFTDPTNGDLTLKVGTNALVDAGVLIPNINDVSAARDLGYVERA